MQVRIAECARMDLQVELPAGLTRSALLAGWLKEDVVAVPALPAERWALPAHLNQSERPQFYVTLAGLLAAGQHSEPDLPESVDTGLSVPTLPWAAVRQIELPELAGCAAIREGRRLTGFESLLFHTGAREEVRCIRLANGFLQEPWAVVDIVSC